MKLSTLTMLRIILRQVGEGHCLPPRKANSQATQDLETDTNNDHHHPQQQQQQRQGGHWVRSAATPASYEPVDSSTFALVQPLGGGSCIVLGYGPPYI